MNHRRILFVCVENAGRSQMAEAFFKKYAPKNYQAISAGTRPNTQINPVVRQAMSEVGISLDSSMPKSITNDMIKSADHTVNMGCMDSNECPALFIKDIIEWSIADPKGKSIEQVREIRDQIESKIKELVDTLEKD